MIWHMAVQLLLICYHLILFLPVAENFGKSFENSLHLSSTPSATCQTMQSKIESVPTFKQSEDISHALFSSSHLDYSDSLFTCMNQKMC